MSFWQQPTFKGNFVAGFDKYVVRPIQLQPPPPDVFWNPRSGQWNYYAPQRYRFIDENLPSIGDLSFAANAETVFDEITQQWAGLAGTAHENAVWDGRQHKWILAEPISGAPGGDDREAARKEYEHKLAVLHELQAKGSLPEQEYERQLAELWNEYKDRI